MTYQREAWEDVSFQVVTGMDGVLRSGYFPTGQGIVNGNVAVDYVWGNFPLQPDEDREGGTDVIPQVEDAGWSPAVKYNSSTLPYGDYAVVVGNPGFVSLVPTINDIAQTGYSNFPEFIENYAGDGDPDPEIKIPNLVRQTLTKAQDLLDPFSLSLFAPVHTLTATYVVTNGKTARVTAYDENAHVTGDSYSYPNSELIGLKVGDQVTLDLEIDGDGFYYENVKITALNVDGENSWFEFKAESNFDPIDFAATGTVYAGTNITDVVLLQRSLIRNPGQQVNVRVMGTI